MMKKEYIPFGKPNFSDDEIEAVVRVMRSGWIGMGQETIEFEKELSEYIGAPHVLTVNSCTSALFLSLLACGIGPGDEVICPSLTWCSTANAALYLGATPVFCDVDYNTLCATPELIEQKLSPKTKAVMVVHMGGLAVDVAEIRAALPDHVTIIEDAAHALGSRYPDGKQVGSSGNLTCFSFYANKNLSTGEGGAVAIFDSDIVERMRALRMQGLSRDAWMRFINPKSAFVSGIAELGYKMNYTDLQACIGRVQLRRQEGFQKTRFNIAKRYYQELPEIIPAIGFQKDILHHGHARHLFVVKLPIEDIPVSRNALIVRLRERNIGAALHYSPLHLMTLYSSGGKPVLQNTEYISERIMTLPISASMSPGDVNVVLEQIGQTIGKHQETSHNNEFLRIKRQIRI